MPLRRLLPVALVLLLAGCVMPFGVQATQPPPPTPESTLPPSPPPPEAAAPEASSTPTLTPATPPGPAILLQQPAGAGTLLLIRYVGGGQTCLAATFTAEVFQANRCGEALTPSASEQGDPVGVGYMDALTDPAGATVRVAYGVVHDPTITAVAVEFVDGGNASAPVQNGGYALVLQADQRPRRASGIDQYGYLVGQWNFE